MNVLPKGDSVDDEKVGDEKGFPLDGDDDVSSNPQRPKEERKGRRKINIEYIEDKSRRHITFSKRKAGIMKKAYELSTLTGTQVLLLVASETGHVYTFATPKLQPLITKPEGKNLIQACLNAPDGTDGGEEEEVKKMDKKGQKMESGKAPYPTPSMPSHSVDPLQYATASGPFPVMYPFSGMPGVPPVQSYVQPGRFGQDYPGLPPNALWSSAPVSKPLPTSGSQLPSPFGGPGGPMHMHPSHPQHSLFPTYAQPK